jgi:hypothetical protein
MEPGATGRQLAAGAASRQFIFPIAFIDDNANTQGTIIRD